MFFFEKENDFIKNLCSSLEAKCDETDKEMMKRFKKLMDKKVGLLISERFINIPADVSLPLYNSLR